MPIRLPPGLMVSVSGFRGRVGESATPDLFAGLAAAYGSFLMAEGDGDHVVVGRDSRTSGPMLERAVVAGLLSVGCRVTELGIVPTPTLMLAVRDTGAAGGLGVTASHNPAEWNALKFAVKGGTFLPPDRMRKYLATLESDSPRRAIWNEIGAVERDDSRIQRHLDQVLDLPFLDADRIRAGRFVVGLDCVNGAGGAIVPTLLERLGCRVRGIGLEPHGRFPRDPEPTAANLGDLGRLVVESGASVGFAVDPDADRLSLVDEMGRPLGEDLTLALAVETVLSRRPGPVATNLSTSRVVEDATARHGCTVHRAPVGEINVVLAMQNIGAVVGGEGNGGVIVPELHYTRDAVVGVALILQRLADSPGAALSELVAELPTYAIVKEKLPFPRERLARAYAALASELPGASADHRDGLRLEWPERASWLHMRPSGTEPVVRLIAEAPTAEAAKALVAQARGVVER